MALDGKQRAIVGFMSVCAVTLNGCGGAKVSPKAEALKGVWIEVVQSDPGANPRIPRTSKRPSKIRRITFQADQKFLFEICSADGKPLPGHEYSGAWSEDGAFILLKLANVPDGDFVSWTPMRTRGVREISTSSGTVKRIRVTDVDDNTFLYRPVE